MGLGIAGGRKEGELWRKLLLGLKEGAQVTFVLAQRHIGGREELTVESRLWPVVCEAVESSGLGRGSWCVGAGDLAAVIFKANTAFLLDNQWSEKEAIHSFIHSSVQQTLGACQGPGAGDRPQSLCSCVSAGRWEGLPRA